jgi:hypothetical protein
MVHSRLWSSFELKVLFLTFDLQIIFGRAQVRWVFLALASPLLEISTHLNLLLRVLMIRKI